MRIVIFASEYSPYNITGTFRILKFAKELRKAGIEIYIITLTEEAAQIKFGAQRFDPSLIDKEEEKFIERVIGLKLFDDFFGFFPFLKSNKSNVKQIIQIIEKINPQIILTTYPHSSTIKLASLIAHRAKLPLVLDMRDAWVHWPVRPYKNLIYYFLTKKWEHKLFRQASQILVVTPPMIDIFAKDHGEWIRKKTSVIFNSYDDSDNLNSININCATIQQKEKIKIGYVGSFYFNPEIRQDILTQWFIRKGWNKFHYYSAKEDWKYRSPYFFLLAFKRLLNKSDLLKEKLQVEFVGEKQDWLPKMINELGLETHCRITGFLQKKDLNMKYSEFDYLLTTSEKVFNGDHYCLPSKLFDYIKLSKPVIGFLTRGIQKEFIEKSGIGFVMDPDETALSVDNLFDIFTKPQTLELNKEYTYQFSINSTTKKLIKILEKSL